MLKIPVLILKKTLKALFYSVIGGLFMLIAVYVHILDSRPDLSVWHKEVLDEEFTRESDISSIDEYRALEDRLFAQLDQKIYERIAPDERRAINRYHRGSMSDPGRWPVNWNRTYEMPSASPKAAVLLLHGMSDSPYSLWHMGQRLNEAGNHVLGLRLPGHGTAPSGLVEAHWEDMAAATRLAVRHLRDQVEGKPIYIVGYSNGGALAVHYALEAIHDPELPQVEGLVLISPAIGVTRLAALAIWQARLGHLLGLEKLAWNDVLPEYDPYKYGSFAVNAGDQSYRIAAAIQEGLNKTNSVNLERFPRMIAFQSVVDATVSVPAVVNDLFGRLPAGGHELVLFDINHVYKTENLLASDPYAGIKHLFSDQELPYTLTVMANKDETSRELVARSREAGSHDTRTKSLGLSWPRGLFSLSHVAMPTPKTDPLYGGPDATESPGIQLGRLDLRGERKVLQIPASEMLRLKWNPFYSYIEGRVLEFIDPMMVAGNPEQAAGKALMECQEPRPQICTQQYDPVCAELVAGPSKTYANGCMACSDPAVQGYRPGACE